MKLINSKRRHLFYFIVIIIFWTIFTGYSFYKSNWFYLDTPTVIKMSKEVFIDKAWLIPDGTGRYFPVVYFYYGIINYIFGDSPFGFYFAQSVIVLTSLLLMYLLVCRLLKKQLIGLLSVLFFLLSSPFYENVYSLGKSEHLLLLFILLILHIILSIIQASSFLKVTLLSILLISLTLIAMWVKETALVLLAFGFALLIYSLLFWFRNKQEIKKNRLSRVTIILISIFVGVISNRLIYSVINSSDSGTYTSQYDINFTLIKSNLIYYLAQTPETIIITGLCLFFSLYYVICDLIKGKFSIQNGVVFSLVVMSFGYLSGLLIWRWPFGYYLYVVSAFTNTSLLIYVYSYIVDSKTKQRSTSKFLVFSIVIVLVLAKAHSLNYGIYIAMTQKAMESTYSEAIKEYTKLAKPNENLFVTNWNFYEEPVYQTNLLLKNLELSSNLNVNGIRSLIDPSVEITPEIKSLYSIDDNSEDTESYPKENDYVLVFKGNTQSIWQVRGFGFFENKSNYFEESNWILNLKSSDAFSAKSLYVDKNKKLGFGKMELSYELFQVQSIGERTSWEGKYSDGWIGKEAVYKVESPENGVLNIVVNYPGYVTTNEIKFIDSNNRIIESLKLNNQGVYNYSLPIKKGETILRFRIDKTFSPIKLGINQDTRELGAQIHITREP